MKYVFHATSYETYYVGKYGEDINEMVNNPHSEEIDTAEFISTVADRAGIKADILAMLGVTESEFANDLHIRCYKSYFQGFECLYVKHSAIEYVFISKYMADMVLEGEEAEARRDIIIDLEYALAHTKSVQKALGRDEIKRALTQFVHDNLSAFDNNNILLASLFTNATPYADIVKDVDEENLL